MNYEQLKDWGWKKAVHPEDWKANKALWQQLISSDVAFQIEHRLLRHDGEYRWRLTRMQPQSGINGKVVLWIGANTYMQYLREEEKRKDDFVIMVSHELKTPVTSIKGYVQLLMINLYQEIELPISATPLKNDLERIDRLVSRLTVNNRNT